MRVEMVSIYIGETTLECYAQFWATNSKENVNKLGQVPRLMTRTRKQSLVGNDQKNWGYSALEIWEVLGPPHGNGLLWR